MSGKVSEEVRYAVAELVAKGVDTMPSVARALRQTKTTASHALRILTDDGYVTRHRYEGGAVLYSYKLLRMPPAPSRKRRGGSPVVVQQDEPVDLAPQHNAALLEQCLGRPALPVGTLRYVRGPVGPI